jgi:predicted nucleic acid-binding protein
VTPLDVALAGATRVGLDTGPFIYFVESHPDFKAVPKELVRRAGVGQMELVTSMITLTEILVQPLRRGALTLIDEYRDILLNGDEIEILDVDATIAETAARLRASYASLRTPDAIQLATAIEAGCGAFLTNDKRLRGISEINVLYLHDLVP